MDHVPSEHRVRDPGPQNSSVSQVLLIVIVIVALMLVCGAAVALLGVLWLMPA